MKFLLYILHLLFSLLFLVGFQFLTNKIFSQCVVIAPVPDDDCYQQVITNDPFCCDTDWDGTCQAAYDDCNGAPVGVSGCNSDVSICTSGVAGPFIFNQTTTGPPIDYANPIGCSTGQFGNDFGFGFIILYITEPGPLNLLVDGDSDQGFIDVVVYNIPDGVTPCDAVLDNANEIGCNYATDVCGCTQFGNDFPCPSSLPAPNVVAGQRIMIIVHDYSDESNSFTLELGPTGSQTGIPEATINPVSTFCVNDAAFQLTSTNPGGEWSGNGVSSTGLFDPALAGIGSHTISYSLGLIPCNAFDEITIDVVNCVCEVTADNSGDICLGESINLIGTATLGSTYLWEGTNFTSNNLNENNVNVFDTAGLYTFYLTASIGNLTCIDSTKVSVNSNPILNAGLDSTICYNQLYVLHAIGNGAISWSNNIPNDSSFVPNVGSTILIASIIDSNFCVNSDTLSIEVTPPITVTFSQDLLSGCTPIEVNFENTTGTNIIGNWYVNDVLRQSNSSTFTYTFDEIRCYDIKLEINDLSCVYSLEKENLICDRPIPEANFEYLTNDISLDEVILFFQNTSTNASEYRWEFGDFSEYDSTLNPNHLYDCSDIKTYNIELFVRNEFSCIDSITKVFIFKDFVNFFIPNTFTPNGDERNNTFKPIFYGKIVEKDYYLKIYNKWGELIFESNDSKIGWDGTYHTRIVKQDTYIWTLEYTEEKSNEVNKLNGFIHLIK